MMTFLKNAFSSGLLFLSILGSADLRKLLLRNRRFWRDFGSFDVDQGRVVVSEQASGSDYWSLIVSISAALLAASYKAKVVFIVRNRSSHRRIFNIVQKTFCRCEFVYLGDRAVKSYEDIKSKSETIFKSIARVDDILGIKYKGIPVGEQIYDSVLKYKHATLWRVDERVLVQIENAINCVDAIDEVTAAHDVMAAIFTHTTGTYHGVAARSILAKGRPVFLAFGGLDAMYRYNRFLGERAQLDIHIKIPQNFFDTLMETRMPALLKEADFYFRQRFGGEINDWDALRAFSPEKKLYRNRLEFFKDFPKLDGGRKTVFIMLHAMNDDPHVQRQLMFRDYYEWFSTTLKIARTNNTVNWVFKQHPMIKFYPDDANLHGLFDLINANDHIEYIDENVSFNSASIPVLADAVVTCAGTAGLEFAALGIPAIITAGNSYAGYGFCYEPQSKDAYLNLLSNVEALKPLEDSQRRRAKVLFYLIYKKLIPGYLTGFFPYLNHDEIKALDSNAAVQMYLSHLSKDMLPKMKKLTSFIQSGDKNSDTELFMNV